MRCENKDLRGIRIAKIGVISSKIDGLKVVRQSESERG